jgi:hypothetical protein
VRERVVSLEFRTKVPPAPTTTTFRFWMGVAEDPCDASRRKNLLLVVGIDDNARDSWILTKQKHCRVKPTAIITRKVRNVDRRIGIIAVEDILWHESRARLMWRGQVLYSFVDLMFSFPTSSFDSKTAPARNTFWWTQEAEEESDHKTTSVRS